jgi:REP-associated tyrosine transposase
MPRANKYILPGYAYHLTHRCHDRQWLLKFIVDRNAYRNRLRLTLRETKVSLLSYCITSSHIHLLMSSNSPGDVGQFMRKQQGEFAEWYNRRKVRSGAFWNGRYHCTMVEGGVHLWNCIRYINLNMVRAGVVSHPRQWRWCGYDEISGSRSKFLVLDRARLIELTGCHDAKELRENHDAMIAEALVLDNLDRQPEWSEPIAVGSRQFVEEISEGVKNRLHLDFFENEKGLWTVKEAVPPYGVGAVR